MDKLKRISNRLENHIAYCLDYPQELITFLKKEGVLKSGMVIAEIGSGKDHSAELFLKERIVVYGIEPKKEMREAGERLLKVYPDFKSIDATAEHTTLEDESVDLIIIGQALHWFDQQKCKQEFKRILKKGVSSSETQVVIIWNQRRTESTPFLKAYEDFIKMFATDYLLVNQKNRIEKTVNDFFDSLPANQEGAYKTQSFLYEQHFDLEGLKCFIQSSSYMPAEGHKDFDFMMSVLKKIFTRYQDQHNLLDKKGKVCIEYDTNIYYGNLN